MSEKPPEDPSLEAIREWQDSVLERVKDAMRNGEEFDEEFADRTREEVQRINKRLRGDDDA